MEGHSPLCDLCHDILLDEDRVEQFTSTEGLILSRVSGDMVKCAGAGCRLCELLLGRFMLSSYRGLPDCDEGCEDTFHFRLMAGTGRSELSDDLTDPFLITCQDFSKLIVEVLEDISEGPKESLDGPYWRYTFHYKLSAAHDDPAAAFITHRPVVTDYSSNHSFSLMRKMLHECTEHHEFCSKPSVTRLPTRVIDVSDAHTIRVVESDGVNGLYVALSYCWGVEKQDIMLTNDTVAELSKGVHLENLPQSIQDAITVTKELGIRYLWVDALCIIQDNMNHKEEQISGMQEIYANSYVALCAANASSCTAGFLEQPRSRIGWYFEPIKVPYRCPNGALGQVIIEPAIPYQFTNEPTWQRAWCMEERLLSPRMLIFGTDAITWECLSKQYVFA